MAEIQSNNAQDAEKVNNGNNVSEKEKQAVYGQRKWPLCPGPSPGPAALPCSPSLVQHYQDLQEVGPGAAPFVVGGAFTGAGALLVALGTGELRLG